MIRQRIREGDKYHCYSGRQMRRIGKNESHIRLMESTIKATWKQFRALEKRFIVPSGKGDEEEVKSEDAASEYSDMAKRDSWQDEKAYAGGRVRDARRMRRRDSQIKGRMGMWEAGLSIDRHTYYNTGMGARFLWWWKQDDIRGLQSRVEGLQIRRIESDLYEIDALVKRGLSMLGGMSGEDPYRSCGEDGPNGGRGSGNGGDGGGGGTRKRRNHQTRSRPRSVATGRRSGNQNNSRSGVREVYEREIRRVRRSPSESSRSRSPPSPSPPTKVASSTMSRGGPRETRSRAPSVVEYEVVNPGRIWVDVEDTRSNTGTLRGSIVDRGGRPPPAHFQSYVRERSPGR